jgi:hypothetical protein
MMRDHDLIEELLAARALDALDADDARTLETALADHPLACAECARLDLELGEVAGLLAASLTPAPVDTTIVDGVLALDRGTTTPARETGEPAATVDDLAERRARRRTRAWTSVVGIAAAIVALVVLTTTVVRGPIEVTTADVAGRVVTFDGDVDGGLAMAYTPGEPGAVFWGHGLPDPGEARTYEIWMIDDGTPLSGGCAVPVDGRIALFVDAEIGTTDLMAVTVEASECPSEPTTDPVLTAELTTA